MLLCLLGAPTAHGVERLAGGTLQRGPAPDVAAELRLMNGLYDEGDAFRAESEALRFLHRHPDHELTPRVELLRAKLYHREGRYDDARLMLISWLDRHGRTEQTPRAHRLLAYTLVRQGSLDEAAAHLPAFAATNGDVPSLAPLREPPPDAVHPDTAVAWSTWLPGSGFFLLGQPGKAAAGLSLNLLFTAGAVLAYQQDNPAAAAIFLLTEIALYTGGRRAVRDEAREMLAAREAERRAEWARAHGERELLRVGLELDF